MKKLYVTLVVVVFAFVTGCQENFITDPNPAVSLYKGGSADADQSGVITINTFFDNPSSIANSFYSVKGEIEYVQKVSRAGSTDPNPGQYYAALYFKVSGKLQEVFTHSDPYRSNSDAGYIDSESKDMVEIAVGQVVKLQKTIQILGRRDGMVLKCRFLVKTNDISLESMWLELPTDGDLSAN